MFVKAQLLWQRKLNLQLHVNYDKIIKQVTFQTVFELLFIYFWMKNIYTKIEESIHVVTHKHKDYAHESQQR